MSELAITKRTFGLEMEYADMDKTKVYLPQGWTWDEEEVITNTDGTRGTFTKPIGGEINTAPLTLTHNDMEKLHDVVRSIEISGAKVSRDNGLDVHIYIGDLTLEELKNIFLLSYHATPAMRIMCKQAEYADEQRYYPAPILEHYLAAKKAETFESLRSVFEDSSKKGFVRYFVNITSYFVRNTVEFRCFNATKQWNEIVDCILFAYRFVNYAITHTEEDFKKLTDVESFIKATKVPKRLPDIETPPIFFSSVKQLNAGITLHSAISVSVPFISMISQNSGEVLSSVNPRLFEFEQKISKHKKIICYNNDELNHILFSIVRNGLRIRYSGYAEFIQEYNADIEANQVASLLAFHKIHNLFRKGEYYENELQAIKDSFDKTYSSILDYSHKLCAFLKDIDYRLGTLNDAIRDGGDIFFNFDDYKRYRTTVTSLKNNSDYQDTFERKTTQYYKVEENLPSGTKLMLISEYGYLNMKKIAQIGTKILYSSDKSDGKIIKTSQKKNTSLSFMDPPDDLDICDSSKLRIVQVTSNELLQAQNIYIKKVQKVSACRMAYMVFYENYFIGGFGFDLPKQSEYDVWLLSDFCTNNKIYRLAKLILYCIQSEEVKKSLSRKMRMIVETMYTKVYSHKPVSMKYRGVFEKVAQESNHLLYSSKFGTSGNIDNIITKYQNLKRKQK